MRKELLNRGYYANHGWAEMIDVATIIHTALSLWGYKHRVHDEIDGLSTIPPYLKVNINKTEGMLYGDRTLFWYKDIVQ